MRTHALVAVALVTTVGSAFAQPPNRKALEARAKTMAKEAQVLEKGKKYREARERYIDAHGIAWTKDAWKGIARIDAEYAKQTQKLLESAKKELEAGKPEGALRHLGDAEKILPGQGAVHYNAAIVLLKLGRDREALDWLDAAAPLITDPGERRRLLEMRSTLTAKRDVKISDSTLKDQLKELNQRMEDNANFESLCADFAKLGTTVLRDDPTLSLNLARCAEGEGRWDEAAGFMELYGKAAPNAVDASDIQRQARELSALKALEGPAGDTIRAEYATAAQMVRRGLYREAVKAYDRAKAAAPDHAETEWRIAALHQALGDADAATTAYKRYLTLEQDPEKRAGAEADLETIAVRQGRDDEKTAEAEKRLLTLLRKTYVSGETVQEEFAKRELALAAEPLEDALSLVPLGLRANALAALLYLAGGNYEAARHSYHAVRNKEAPIVWFGRFTAEGKAPLDVLAKMEVTTEETLVVIPMANWDKKKKQWVVLEQSSALLDTYPQYHPPSTSDRRNVIKRADIKTVETKNSYIEVVHAAGKLVIQPQYVGVVPPAGPLARRSANPYAKMLRDFLPFKGAELGKESMTGGEKFAMAMSIASSAMGAYNTGMMANANLALQARRAAAIAQAIQAGAESLQSSIVRQRKLLQATGVSQFRLMPTELHKPEFRAELMR